MGSQVKNAKMSQKKRMTKSQPDSCLNHDGIVAVGSDALGQWQSLDGWARCSTLEEASTIAAGACEGAILAGCAIWGSEACIHLVRALHIRALTIGLASGLRAVWTIGDCQ